MVTMSIDLGNGFIEKCEKLRKAIPKCYDRAKGEALKKGITALTDSKGGAPSVYNIKKGDLRQYVSMVKDGIRARSRRFTVGTDTHFSITPARYASQAGIPVRRRKRMSVTIKKRGRKPYPHGFIVNPARVGHTMIWERDGSGAISPVRTVSAAQMAANDKVHPYVEEQMLNTLEKRFQHHYDRIKV